MIALIYFFSKFMEESKMKFNFKNQVVPNVVSNKDNIIALYSSISNGTEIFLPCKVLDFDHAKGLVKIAYVEPMMCLREPIKTWVPMDFILIAKR